MADRTTVEEVMAFLRDNKPAEWDRFKGMSADEYDRIITNWARTLEPVPDTVLLQVAVIAARQPGAYMPPPGALYDAALDLLDNAPDVADAWALVEKQARGSRAELPDRVSKAVARMGGTGGWKEDEMGIKRAQFSKEYDRVRSEWKRQAALPGVKMLGSG